MNNAGRLEHFEPRMPFENTSEEEPRRSRPFRAVALWLGMAVLGAVLAVTWRNFGAELWSDSQRWLATAAASSSNGTSSAETQLGRIVGDLDAQKKTSTSSAPRNSRLLRA